MALDGSLISGVEGWAVGALRALSQFEDNQVIHYPGLALWDQTLPAVMEEFIQLARKPFVTVGWKSSASLPQPADDSSDRESLYMVHLVTENMRDAAARTGETGVPGTNLLTELIIDALHDKRPFQSSATLPRESQQTDVKAARIILAPRGVSIVELELVVREVPNA